MRVSGKANRVITAGLVFLLAAGSTFMVSASQVDQDSDRGQASTDTAVTEDSAGLSRTGITDLESMAPRPTGDSQDEDADHTEQKADTAKTGEADKADTAKTGETEKADAAKTGEAEKADAAKTEAAEKADTGKTGEADTASSTASPAADAVEAADSQNTAVGSTAVNAEADQAASAEAADSDVSPRVKKAEEVFGQFLAGSKTVTYSAENVSITDSTLADIFEDGKKYTFKEFEAAIQSVESTRHEAATGEMKAGDTVTAEYTFLEQGPAETPPRIPLTGWSFITFWNMTRSRMRSVWSSDEMSGPEDICGSIKPE